MPPRPNPPAGTEPASGAQHAPGATRARASGATLLARLQCLAQDEQRERIFVRDLFVGSDDRAGLPFMLVFALPNVVPVPPGTSAILGAPLVLLTLQWLLGRPPWLPRRLTALSMSRADYARLLQRVTPWAARLDRASRPRLPALVGPLAARLIGALCLLLALIILLPIPFGNMLPALAISLVVVGMLRRDGACVLVGAATGVASIALVWNVSLVLIGGALDWLQKLVA